MRRFVRGSLWLFAASLAGLGPAGAAQQPAPSGGWNVDWGDHRCSLIRQDSSTPANSLALAIVPGNYSPSLRLVSRSRPRRVLSDPDRIRVSFEPQGILSSSDPALDATTCRIMRERVRLEPARDADGAAIPVSYVSSITWRIMGRSP